MENYSGNKEAFVYIAHAAAEKGIAEEICEAVGSRAKLYCSDVFGKKEEGILKKAAAVIPVVGGASAAEMEAVISAAANAGKEMIPVFSDMEQLPAGISMLLGTTQGVIREAYPDKESFQKALLSSPLLGKLKVTPAQQKAAKNAVVAAVCAIAVLVAIVAIAVLKPFAADKIDKDSTLGKLGLSGNASSIKTVALYGDTLEKEFEDKGVYQAYANTASDFSSLYLPGADKVVSLGTLSDLSDFSQLVNLEELALAGNSVSDITPLLGLSKLKKLDLSDQHYIEDGSDPEARGEGAGLSLEGISALQNLEYLNIAFNDLEATWSVSSVEEIKSLPKLKTLVADAMIAEQLGDVSFDVVIPGTIVSSYEEVKAAAADPECHAILVTGGSEIVIPAGEEFTLPAHVTLTSGGGWYTLRNNGTMHVFGWVEGLADEYNNGTLIIEEGGSWIGGMSEIYNDGTFIVANGGFQSLERGKFLHLNSGSYILDGELFIGVGGTLEINGGTAENNGSIKLQIAPEGMGMFSDPNSEFMKPKFDNVKKFTGDGTFETVMGGAI